MQIYEGFFNLHNEFLRTNRWTYLNQTPVIDNLLQLAPDQRPSGKKKQCRKENVYTVKLIKKKEKPTWCAYNQSIISRKMSSLLFAQNSAWRIRKAVEVLAGSTNPGKETIERLEELTTKFTPRTTLTVDDTGTRVNNLIRATQELMSSSNAMDRLRMWSVKYDGDTNPLEFVELCETYEVLLTLMPKTMIELSIGQALMWCRNNR